MLEDHAIPCDDKVLLENYLSEHSSLSEKDPKLSIQFKNVGIEETTITSIAVHDYMKKLNDRN